MLMVVKIFFNGTTINIKGKRASVIKHSHGRFMVGDFDKILHEGSIWNGQGSVISSILQKSLFLHFVHHATKFYDIYIYNMTT